MRDRRALAALMEAVERQLPQSKRNALLREYKKGSMALRRREKKGVLLALVGTESRHGCVGACSYDHMECATLGEGMGGVVCINVVFGVL